MQFSDTSTKQGLIQECEFWTNLGDVGISGDATLLKVFTNRINRAFDRVMPLLLSRSDKMRWDDANHTDAPVATASIAANQHDYPIYTDDNSLAVLNVTDVMMLDSASSTEYRQLPRITVDDPRALRAMSPNPSDRGIPSGFVEKDGVIYLSPAPNYSVAAGLKVFFERAQSYFASSDTTKKPGIPQPFHMLLALYAALDWLLVNKSEATALITRVQAEIERQRTDLERNISNRTPVRRRLVGAPQSSV